MVTKFEGFQEEGWNANEIITSLIIQSVYLKFECAHRLDVYVYEP